MFQVSNHTEENASLEASVLTSISEEQTVLSKKTEPPDKEIINENKEDPDIEVVDKVADSETETHNFTKVSSQWTGSATSNVSQDKDCKVNRNFEKTKDSLQRNVFDAFPVGSETSSKKSIESDIHEALIESVSNEVKEEASKISDLNSMKLKQVSERHKTSKNTDFLSSFESFLKAQNSSDENSSASNTTSNFIQHSSTETLKPSTREPRSRHVEKKDKVQQKSKSAYLSENVKKKFPKLKELRVSLDSKEVIHHANSFLITNQDTITSLKSTEKYLNGKMSKLNERTSVSVIASASDSVSSNMQPEDSCNGKLKPSDKTEDVKKAVKGNTVLDTSPDIVKSSAAISSGSHHIFDNDSAKPLKKRGRRGKRFESFDRVNEPESHKAEETNLAGKTSDAENQHIKIIDTVDVGVVKDVVQEKVIVDTGIEGSRPVNEVKSTEPIKSNNQSSIDISTPVFVEHLAKKERKGKKRKRTKCKNVKIHNQKKVGTDTVSETMESSTKQSENKMTSLENSDASRQLKATRSLLHRKCSNSDVLKKYPERSCKIHKVIQEEKKEKKIMPKSSAKTFKKIKTAFKKLVPASDKCEDLTDKSGDFVKPKKKRKRKVKPWSWGNEKKKYKPKPKVLPVLNASKGFDSNDIQPEIKHETDVSEIEMKATKVEMNELVVEKLTFISGSIEPLDKNIRTSDKCDDTFDSVRTYSVINEGKMNNHQTKKSVKKHGFRKRSKSAKNKKAGVMKNNKQLTAKQPENTEECAHKTLEAVKPLQKDTSDIKLIVDSEIGEESTKLKKETGGLISKEVIESKKNVPLEHIQKEASDLNISQGIERGIESRKEIVTIYSLESSSVDVVETEKLTSASLPCALMGTESVKSTKTVRRGKRGKKGRKGSRKGKNIYEQNLVKLDSDFVHEKSCSDELTEDLSCKTKLSPDQDTSESDKIVLPNNSILQALAVQQQQLPHIVDHEPRLDTAHVSPDSGIESVAGSPVGNESPSSVLSSEPPSSISYHPISNPSVSCSNSDNCLFNDNIFVSSSSVTSPCVSSSSTLHDSLVSNMDMTSSDHNLFLDKSLSVITATSSLNCVQNVPQSKPLLEESANEVPMLDSKKQSESSKPSDSLKVKEHSAAAVSPSKKKNRAKFLLKHKASVLLQQGRMPTEEEKEHMLEDKFSYLSKISHGHRINLEKAHDHKLEPTSDQNKARCEEFLSNSSDLEKVDQKAVNLNETVLLKSDVPFIEHEVSEKYPAEASASSSLPFTSDVESSNYMYASETESMKRNLSDSFTNSASKSEDTLDFKEDLSDSVYRKPMSDNLAVTGEPIDEIPGNEIVAEVLDSSQNSELVEDIFIPSIQENFEIEKHYQNSEKLSTLKSNMKVKTLKKRGRPPGKHKKIVVKKKPGRPKGSKNKQSVPKKKHLSVIKKHYSNKCLMKGKGEKITKHLGRPKGSCNKPKVTPISTESNTQKQLTSQNELNEPVISMMQWRESKEQTGLENFEQKKRKRGRPRKNPLPSTALTNTKTKLGKKQTNIKKSKQGDLKLAEGDNALRLAEKEFDLMDHAADTLDSVDHSANTLDSQFLQRDLSKYADINSNNSELFFNDLLDTSVKRTSPKIRKSKLHLSVRKDKRKTKDSKIHSKHKSSDLDCVADLTDHNLIQDHQSISLDLGVPDNLETTKTSVVPTDGYPPFIAGPCPPQSDRSIDSDTSGAGSSLGAKSSSFHLLFEYSRHKRKKSKKKLLYFRTKHKNIIDPVFIGEVDYLIREFPHLSISSPEETFLKVRPGEVPLPSIFRVNIINVKKKKKDKLLVFEKSRPMKHKNVYDSDKLKLGRRKGTDENLFDIFGTELADLNQPHYLPPKKRHKLFSAADNEKAGCQKSQEKRKVGRPKKVRPPSPSHIFSFGK